MNQKRDERIKNLKMPSYNTLKLANDLTARLMEPIKNKPEKEIKELFIFPDSMICDDEFNSYFYPVVAAMAFLVVGTKDWYRKNDIVFSEKDFLDDDCLFKCIPSYEAVKIKNINKNSDFKSLLNIAMTHVIEAIETEFAYFHDHNPEKTSKQQEQYIKNKISNIVSYAKIGRDIGRIIQGYDILGLGGKVICLMDFLKNKRTLLDCCRKNELDVVVREILFLHAELFGLFFEGESYLFRENFGHENSFVMEVARKIKDYTRVISEIKLGKKHEDTFCVNGFVYTLEDVKGIKKNSGNNYFAVLTQTVMEDEDVSVRIMFTRSPFLGLEDKLEVLGIGSKDAKKIVEYFSYNFNERTLSQALRKKIIKDENIFSELEKPGENYPTALSFLIKQITGKEPNRMSFKFFDNINSLWFADYLKPITYVSTIKDKKIKMIAERSSNLDLKKEFIEVKKRFSGSGIDIYVRQNKGVCFMMGFDNLDSMLSPEISIVESRDAYVDIKKIDPYLHRLLCMHTDIHETVHAAQVSEKIVYRDLVSSLGIALCDTAIKQAKLGSLDFLHPHQGIFSFMTANGMKAETWRKDILHWYESEMLFYLGENSINKDVKRMGIYAGVKNHKLKIEQGRVDLEKLRRKTKLEKSTTVELNLAAIEAIKSGDIDRMYACREALEEHVSNLTAIIEQSAEAFSVYGLGCYLQFGSKKSIKKKQAYLDAITNSIIRRGDQANIFFEVYKIAKNKTDLQDQLRYYGLVYKSEISYEDDVERVKKALLKLGYDPLDPYGAYNNMQELIKRVRKNGKSLQDFLLPINSAVASIGMRYGAEIPLFLQLIEKYGSKKAFKLLCNSESIEDIILLLAE